MLEYYSRANHKRTQTSNKANPAKAAKQSSKAKAR